MIYRAYRDKTLLIVTHDKKEAFRCIKQAKQAGAHYFLETDGKKEEYYLTHRVDGAIQANKTKSAEKKFVRVPFSRKQYLLIKKTAESENLKIATWAKKNLLEIAKKMEEDA